MTEITSEMIAAFRRAAFDRQMHEDGCPEGEGIKAGIAAIAPMIRAEALEEAAKVATYKGDTHDCEYRGVQDWETGEVPCDFSEDGEICECAVKYECSRTIAAAIRALKEKANAPGS